MKTLILDTSTDHALIAISEKGKLLTSERFSHGNQISKLFLPTIQDILQKQGLSLQEFAYIGVGIGPGSYTGTRVGAVVAQHLAFALGIPLVPFCSLLAFVPENEGEFTLTMEAKSGLSYAVTGKVEGGKVEYVLPQSLTSGIADNTPKVFNPSLLAQIVFQAWEAGRVAEGEKLELIYLNNL